MAFAQRLDMRQSQQLVMTPQLQQAIKMLQMSNLELKDFIAEEIERNPLLETTDAASSTAQEGAEAQRTDRDPATERLEQTLSSDRLDRAEETFDCGAENLYADLSRSEIREAASVTPAVDAPGGPESLEASAWATVGRGGGPSFDDEDFSLEARLSGELTLRETLLAQLGEAKTPPTVRLVAAELIEALDESGYLRADLEESASRLGATPDVMEAAVALLQSFDPVGVAARSLAECLELQLRERNRLDPAMALLIDNLELVAKREFDRLKRVCKVDNDDLIEMLSELKALDPKPGLQFQHDVAQTLIPDVYVHEDRFGGWTVELNTDTLPRLVVNNSYAATVMRGASGEKNQNEIKEYISERQQSANWLLKSIEQRAKTILRVSAEIVRQQDGFFAYGVTGLKPLNLKRVAEAIDMHESTVSRVTSNKYVATPRGVFELKYFFTPGIASTSGGEAYSAEAIRHKIKTLIDSEPRDAVLSDDRIVAILRDAGVDIARRTVTKYREALGIPSSIQRRKERAMLSVS